MATISEALAIGIQHHRAGRLQAAEQIYRQILQAQPNQADAWHLLGLIAQRVGKHAIAIEHIGHATRINPAIAAFQSNLGLSYQAIGNLDQAAACWRRALELKPDHVETHIALGNILKDQGKLDETVACYRRALLLRPDFAPAHYNLGNALKEQQKPDDAIACYRRALELKPDFAEAYVNLGNVLKDQGKPDEAVVCYRQALQLAPDSAEAHNNLGVALKDQGKLQDAITCYRRALELSPNDAVACYNLGGALVAQGKLEEAITCYRRTLELKPDYVEAHVSLGIALKDQGKLDEALACHHRAILLKPDFAPAHTGLGLALQDRERLDEAIACYHRALELKPDDAETHNNLGNTLKDQGKLHEALACYRRALELKPDFVQAHSNLLYAQVFCPGCDPQALREEHRRWNQQHAEPLARFIQPHRNDRSADCRLRVGYVSPDFRDHSESYFTVPLLSAHDHQNIQIFCYADVIRPDRITARLRSYADVWRNIAGLGDEQVAQLVRQDGIDILVDLTMHMARNRLLVFARKPAPVQVCWLAYQGTTGLSTIDYRLTDSYLDPPGLYDRFYAENSVCLPDAFWCYDPLADGPAVNDLPALKTGCLTFGCLNNFCKVNPSVLMLWAQVLRAVDRSRLVLLAAEGSHRQETLALLEQEGIQADRVTFVARRPRPEYLNLYHDIDLGLDTFPYTGQTTSLDAIWLGVPVVTLVGQTAAARAGLSLLSNLGLPDLAASTPDEFVSGAVDLANDLPCLRELRATLRQRLQASPLMDAAGFARSVEAAYRTMWRRWCTKPET